MDDQNKTKDELLKELSQARQQAQELEAKYRCLFEDSPLAVWEEDFTEVKRYFDELRAQGVTDFRSYFEAHPEAVFQCATKVKIVDVNPTTLTMFEADSVEDLLAGLNQVFGEESVPVFKEQIISLAEGKTHFASEAINTTLTGRKLNVFLSLAVAPGYKDSLAKVFVSIMDMTERKQAEAKYIALMSNLEQAVEQQTAELNQEVKERQQTEQQLREAHSQLEAIFLSFPDMYFTFDQTSKFIGFKQGAARGSDLYVPPELFLDKQIEEVLPPEISQKFKEAIQHVLETEETTSVEYQLEMSDGTHYYEGRLANLSNQQVFSIVRDITDRKQSEINQVQLQEELIETQRKAITELSTPIIPILKRIIIMPLIGKIDTPRASDLMRSMLAGISQYRAKVVIVDVTGVSTIDNEVAAYLNRTIQAARLKGAKTILTGISDEVAETIIDLGIDWSEVQTLNNLQAGLLAAMRHAQVELSL